MCGISGIVDKNNKAIGSELIKEINDLVSHRGPDDEGFFFGDNFALGHRRLSILDLSSDGHQPMLFSDKYVITYNGEVYNYIEIRNELEGKGYQFKSHSDTEVILAAYDFWGTECVHQFNGMWGFVIYDKTQNKLFCSRDRFGIKPFYYTEVNGKFVFGSEIKQLLNFYPDRYVNKSVLLDFIVLGISEHTKYTFFENIYSLLGGHNLYYDLSAHSLHIEKYYDISVDESAAKLNEADSIKLYKEALERSIKLRLRSDVKVGTCLSGGLDSSSIAAIAGNLHKLQSTSLFTAITASSLDPTNDETQYAEIVAKSSGLDWHTITPSSKDFIKQVDHITKTQEEPFDTPSIVMQYCVFAKAKELGCIVMLDGQGGDETLLGYERYYPSYLLSLPPHKMFSSFWRSSENSKLSKLRLLAYGLYFLSATIRKRRLLKRNKFLKTSELSLVNWSILERLAKSYKDSKLLQKLEIQEFQMPHLLRYEDRNSMVHSIESRLPFIDYQVVETALSLPDSYKMKGGWTKYLLRKAIDSYLPDTINWRKNKLAFNAPADIWLREFNADIEFTIKNSEIIKTISNQCSGLDKETTWKLFFIAKWEQAYNVKIRN